MGRWLATLLIAVGLWTTYPQLALAAKAVEPIIFDPASTAISVMSVYETTAASQKSSLKEMFKTSKSFYKKIPGFKSFAVFGSSDGSRMIELSQWQDQASYDAFQVSLAEAPADYTQYYKKYLDDDESPEAASEPVLTASFAIDQAIAPPGMVSAIPGDTSLVQITEFRADTPEHQAELLDSVQTLLAEVPSLYPAPHTAIVLRGIDSPYVALLANWGAAAEFIDPSQVPTLTLPAEAEASPEPPWLTKDENLYQVVKVIAAQPEKYGKD
ncbi:MAG: antibiotic biosynthesis monooxygenase family protein [Nodosilinea sp.]